METATNNEPTRAKGKSCSKPSKKTLELRAEKARDTKSMKALARFYYGSITDEDFDESNFLIPVGDASRSLATRVQKFNIYAGQAGEDLARWMIDKHEGFNRPLNLYGPGVDADSELPKISRGTYFDGSEQTVIWSRLPKAEIEAHANSIIVAFIDNLKPSERTTEYLEFLVSNACSELARIPERRYENEANAYIVDIAYETLDKSGRARTLHLSEMKTGGELGPNHIKAALSTVVRARLALHSYKCRIFIGAIQALEKNTSRFERAIPNEMFYKGKSFWETITPEYMNFDRLKATWKRIATDSEVNAVTVGTLTELVVENLSERGDLRALIKNLQAELKK